MPSGELSQIITDSGAGVLILDSQGRVLSLNDVAARIFARRPAHEALGLRLSDIMPNAAAAERLDVARQVILSGVAVMVRDLWNGFALRCTIRRLESWADSAQPVAMIVCAPESALLEEPADASIRMVEPKHIDLGPLADLTASELRVLALIGEGMSNAEIAARLHRAIKTVESHRAALTDKTGTTSRVQLGIMARRAGLLRRVGLPDAGPAPAVAS